jgi:hypothetical protein
VVSEFPADARCEIVFAHYGNLHLTVAAADAVDGSQPDRHTLQNVLEKLKAERELPMQVIDDPQMADWRLVTDRSLVYLSPAQGDLEAGSSAAAGQQLGGLSPAELPQQLPDVLRRIARAELLLKIAARRPAAIRGTPAVAVGVEMLKFRNENDDVGIPVETVATRPRLVAGDIVGFRVTNRSKTATLYVTLLSMDAGRGITAVYPDLENGLAPDPIERGQSFQTRSFRVRHDGGGVESLVALAVKASGPPISFAGLLQPTLAQAQQISRTRAPGSAGSALAELLEGALFAAPTTRGLESVERDQCATAVLTWETAPANTNPKR